MTDLELAAYIDRGLPAEERERIENHIAYCEECRGAVVAGRDLAHRARRRTRFVGLAMLAAAAAVVMAVFPRGGPGTPDERMRADGATAPLMVHGPIAESSGPVRFTWQQAQDALSYRLRLSTAAGTTLWTHNGPDTSALLPDSVRLQPAARYFWTVDALLRDGSSRSTGLREFVQSP